MGRRDRIRKDYRKKNYNKYNTQFSVKIPKTDKRYCVELDKLIKSLEITVSTEHRKQIQADSRPSKRSTIEKKEKLQIWRDILKDRTVEFSNMRCATNIENLKTKETAKIIGQEVEKYEDDVLESSDDERKKLFIIGGAFLLGALGIILVLTKKSK